VPNYRAENSHLINRKQVNNVVNFRAPSDVVAKQRFVEMRTRDKTIQEAGLFRVKDEILVDEYIGYI
jgi:hypothetical protein